MVAALVAFGLVPTDAAAQEPPTNGASGRADRPAIVATQRQSEIRLDGRPDEAAWSTAIPATQFVQREPVENAPAEQPTAVRVLFDDRALYIAASMRDPEAARIGDQLVRRDERGQYDWFEVALDPNNDRRTGYRFRVSAAGVQRDVYLHDDVEEDEAWDAVWQSAVYRDSTGWSTEIRIPLSQLRYNAADSLQSWGVNFSRRRLASNELTDFALESRVRHGKVSVFGRLDGLWLNHGARHIEVRPYALARAHTAPSEPGDPFFDGSELGQQVGLDLRYGLGAGYTLDATINPDFGQVEVDPAVINLTAFETFFPEKRPFFVENAQIFDFELSGRRNQLFYSRRIGREPHGSAPDDSDFQEIPTETTILGAAKLTGRTAGGLSIGGLAALTGKETGSAHDSVTGTTDRFTAEPFSQYGVVRLQQDLRDGATQLGAIVTAAHRNLPENGNFNFLNSSAYSLGLDFEHSWGGSNSRDWALWGYFAGSLINGSTEALLHVQEASNHYFQRPDATRFSVDSTATSMSGVNWRLQFERRSAKHWTGAVWLGEITPGFEVNDLGFSTSGERLDAGARISYQEITPGSLFRSYRFYISTFHNWRHEALDDVFSTRSWGRAHKSGTFSMGGNVEFLNYWRFELNTDHRPETLSDTDTRGGPLMIDPASNSVELSLRTDRRAPIFLEPRLEYTDRRRGGHRWETGLEISLRPTPSLEIEFEPRYNTELQPAQYVTQTDDLGYAPTFGRYYLFSDLKRRQFSVETRLNAVFNPRLSLQLYAQPLVSSGDYLTYKQLARAESFDFDILEEGRAVVDGGTVRCMGGRTCVEEDERYVDFDRDGVADFEFEDQDFNIHSLRVNAVLRWEFRPGSALFLVWQQSRRDRRDTGSFDLGRDLETLWDLDAENIFILKIDYWLGL